MTKQRAKLSLKNPNWISPHRYYELKHFCLQYPEWKREYGQLSLLRSASYSKTNSEQRLESPTEELAIKCIFLKRKMELIENAAEEACDDLASHILQNVTTGSGYNETIPCCKNTYYKYYRRFFALLDKKKRNREYYTSYSRR